MTPLAGEVARSSVPTAEGIRSPPPFPCHVTSEALRERDPISNAEFQAPELGVLPDAAQGKDSDVPVSESLTFAGMEVEPIGRVGPCSARMAAMYRAMVPLPRRPGQLFAERVHGEWR